MPRRAGRRRSAGCRGRCRRRVRSSGGRSQRRTRRKSGSGSSRWAAAARGIPCTVASHRRATPSARRALDPRRGTHGAGAARRCLKAGSTPRPWRWRPRWLKAIDRQENCVRVCHDGDRPEIDGCRAETSLALHLRRERAPRRSYARRTHAGCATAVHGSRPRCGNRRSRRVDAQL